jgi:hypothetical protein
MKKYTIYKDNRTSSQRVTVGITKPTERNAYFGCATCGRQFKRNERVMKVSFRWLAPRTICSGCAHTVLTEAIQSLGRIHKSGKGKPFEYPEWLKPQKYTGEQRSEIPF